MQSIEIIILVLLVHILNFGSWGQVCGVTRDVSVIVLSPMDRYRANLLESGCQVALNFAIQCDSQSILLFDNDYGPKQITSDNLFSGSRTIIWNVESYIIFDMGSMTTVSAIILFVINSPDLYTGLPNIHVYLPASLNQTEADSHTPQVSYDFLHNEHLSETDSTIRIITLRFRDMVNTNFVLLRWTFVNSPFLLFGLSELRICGDQPPISMPQSIQFQTPTHKTTLLQRPTSGSIILINVNCSVSNSGSFTWEWTRDQQIMPTTSLEARILYYDGTRSSSLVIQNTGSFEDGVVYSCRVISDHYPNVTAIRHFISSLSLILKNYGFVRNVITCEAYGFIEDINSSITWSINGSSFNYIVNVRTGSRYLVSLHRSRPSIISTLIYPGLYGTYTCMIGNESASRTMSFPTTAPPTLSTTVSIPPTTSQTPTTTSSPQTPPTTVSTSLTTLPATPTALQTPPITTLAPPTAPTTASTAPTTTSTTISTSPTTGPTTTSTSPTTAPTTTSTIPAPPTTPSLAGIFDIKNIFVSIENLEITLKTIYVKDSSASGAFFVVVPVDFFGEAVFESTNYLALDRKTSLNFTLPFSLKAGRTIILVYDIERDGVLTTGEVYPAVSADVVVVKETTSGPPLHDSQYHHLENCSANPLLNSVKVECSYRKGFTAAGFQVIVHQRDEIDKLYVVQSQTQSMARVPVRRDVDYQVAVFSIREGRGIVGSSVEYLKQLIVEVKSTAPIFIMNTAAAAGLNSGDIILGTVGGVIGIAVLLVPIVFYMLRRYFKKKEVGISRSQGFGFSHSSFSQRDYSNSSIYTIPYENSSASL